MAKRALKIIGIILLLSVFVFGAVVSPYAVSFLSSKYDTDFAVSLNENLKTELYLNKKTTLDLDKCDNVNRKSENADLFNYYGILYRSDSYIKGEICYKVGLKEVTEEFFLEPSGENGEVFYSFIDNCLDGVKGSRVETVSFENLSGEGNFSLLGISVFNREIPQQEIYIESDEYKLGVDLLWGGALSYLEDLNSNVQAVLVDGKIKVDSNAAERYNTESVNNNVNLINRNDTGRLVQQSYYGTLDYDFGTYMENDWHYNPVQGGNQFNDASKIVDLRIEDNLLYIKCRPLDWAKEKEFATPSYMEATYTIEERLVKVSCRFVDFSGYPEAESTQELPAFYCIEPLNEFVYYKGDKPWTDEPLTEESELIFWPDAGYPNFVSPEHWSAFKGEFDDSFGIGLYVPDKTTFLTGVYMRGETTNSDPSRDDPTSYIAVVENRKFQSYVPSQYEFYLTTGNTTEIRNAFKALEN